MQDKTKNTACKERQHSTGGCVAFSKDLLNRELEKQSKAPIFKALRNYIAEWKLKDPTLLTTEN